MPASQKEFLDIEAIIEWIFSLKCMHDMIRIYSQLHRTDKYSKHSSLILTVFQNGRVFVYEVSGSGLDSSFSHLNFTLPACFDQGCS